MKVIGIIPARMASSRFPGKPLKKICNICMIGHVYYRSKMSIQLDELYVATCDKEIKEYIESIGGKAIMTSDSHERASDRSAEALEYIEKQRGEKVDIVVMIQGDEPMLTPEMIDDAVIPLIEDEEIYVSNLMSEIEDIKEFQDSNNVKVVVDRQNFALYFSREPIPSMKKYSENVKMLKQVCIIPFKRDFLLEYLKLEPTPLEIFESVDMNRILEHGMKVKMIPSKGETYAVDTEQDLARVEKLMQEDKFFLNYYQVSGSN